jgi:hypothetical protein
MNPKIQDSINLNLKWNLKIILFGEGIILLNKGVQRGL